jgi:type IX secretion system PorP/SprF family membrane protein
MRKILWTILFLTASFGIKAQIDPTFSQSLLSPIILNPAATGVYYGGARLSSNYRQQWATVSQPYTTMQVAFDKPIIDNIWVNDFVALGITVSSDNAGVSNFLDNTAKIMVSYGKALDPRERNFVTVGFEGGVSQKSVTFSGLNWESQFNRLGFDQSLPTGEPYIDDKANSGVSVLNPDFGMGIQYVYNNEETKLLKAGISIQHITKPTYEILGREVSTYRRINFHVDYKAKPNGSTLSFWPKMLYSIQGPSRLLYIGSDFHWLLQQAGNITGSVKEISFALGPYYRHKEGMSIQSRLQVGGLTVGASYDFNLNQLRTASNLLGGPEVLVVYQTGYKKGRNEKHNHKRFAWRYD